MNNLDTISEEEKFYSNWFVKMASARSAVVAERKEDEERYFADVEGTRTQFRKEQLDEIRDRYDIPISSKLSYAIVEILLSFLSGSKPYPRLVAPSELPESKLFTEMYEQAHNGVWYESNGNDELTNCLRNMINVGSGFMHVRKNNFFGETTFNAINEYVPWQHVLVDPNSQKADFSDAEMMCIVKVMPITKAEKEYDIELNSDDSISGMMQYDFFDLGTNFKDPYIIPMSPDGYGNNFRNDKYVWTRLFYENKDVNVFVSENSDIGVKRPVPIMVPNPKKVAIGQQIEQMKPMLQQIQEEQQQLSMQSQAHQEDVQTSQDPTEAMTSQQQFDDANAEQAKQAAEMLKQYQMLQIAFQSEPDQVPAYSMETLSKDKDDEYIIKTVFKVERMRRKQIKRVLMVGRHIVESEILPCQICPLVHFPFLHNLSPNKTYGISHIIKDFEKANNKFWAAAVYDVQTNSHRKVLAPKGSIVNTTQWEQSWSVPGAIIEWEPNESLALGNGNYGKPEIVDASPLNQALVQLITMLTNLTEYVTGIFGVMQGNSAGAPDTFGGTSALQNFGSQRVKLYGRRIESALERLALVTVEFLQAYAPKNKVIQYFSGESDEATEMTLLESPEDLRFKVRVSIANNLPTTRHLNAQLLSTIAGQTSNPQVADILTQFALKAMDMPEADQIIQAMDVIKNLQQQLGQMQQQLKESDNRNKALENQNIQQNLSAHIQAKKMEVDHHAETTMMENEEPIPDNESVEIY